jgi:hypothetical protein
VPGAVALPNTHRIGALTGGLMCCALPLLAAKPSAHALEKGANLPGMFVQVRYRSGRSMCTARNAACM